MTGAPIRADERYTTAISTDNLRMDTREHASIGDVDVLTAAAWAPARLGSALLRLVSEFGRPIRLQGMSRTDAILLVGKLKSLRSVQIQLAIQLKAWGHKQPMDAALAIIAWRLDKVCNKCTGRGYEVVPGTNRLSAKVCVGCHGTGETRLPQGEMGRRAANYMDNAMYSARQSMSKKLRFFSER